MEITSENKVLTNSFESIQLKDIDRVKLMNRIDRKYWFHKNDLQQILNAINQQYYILEIDGESLLPYKTTYFDTVGNEMFNNHQNGKLNRYKIRKRSYVASNISFLEVKFKSNKGRTIKKRIPIKQHNSNFSNEEALFIDRKSPYVFNNLQTSLINRFNRITLVNKNFKERCTIDLNIQFKHIETEEHLNDMVIVEIKSDGDTPPSLLALVLRDLRIKKSGFSKYCVGRTVTDINLKRNSFKVKIRSIEKLLQMNHKLYKTA